MDVIEDENYGDIECIVMKILQRWLNGNGRAVTWQILVETLKECEIHDLAKQIEEDKRKGTVWVIKNSPFLNRQPVFVFLSFNISSILVPVSFNLSIHWNGCFHS